MSSEFATELALPGFMKLKPPAFEDSRGWFSELFSERRMEEAGLPGRFVQDNWSVSNNRGTLRGFHYQAPPKAQGKMIWVVSGAVLDVAVDLRPDSPTFGQSASYELRAESREALFLPGQFAHAFLTLEDNTTILYKATDFYSPEHEQGIAWDDPVIGFDWPDWLETPVQSERDTRWPKLDALPRDFA